MAKYYKTAHEALYMRREYGVQVHIIMDGKCWPADTAKLTAAISYDTKGVKYYIAEESLPIFEPMEGDLVENPCNKGRYSPLRNENIQDAEDMGLDIIQRNGKAFIWPEEE